MEMDSILGKSAANKTSVNNKSIMNSTHVTDKELGGNFASHVNDKKAYENIIDNCTTSLKNFDIKTSEL